MPPALLCAIWLAVPSRTSKTAPLPHLLGRKGSHLSPLWRDYRQSEYSIVSVGNISLPGQSEEGAAEQENLNSPPQ